MGSKMQIIKCEFHHQKTHIHFPKNQKLGKGFLNRKFNRFFFILLLFMIGAGAAWASSDKPDSRKPPGEGPLFHFYKTVVSATDGDRCGMSPSCSSYAAQAFKKHGFFMGWMMSCDRLIRCGRDETRLSPHIQCGNRSLTRDTLEDNDFWWFHNSRIYQGRARPER